MTSSLLDRFHDRAKKLEERAQERLFYEGEHGMRDVGWYVSPPEGKVRGPFLTEKAALKEAIRTVEEEN